MRLTRIMLEAGMDILPALLADPSSRMLAKVFERMANTAPTGRVEEKDYVHLAPPQDLQDARAVLSDVGSLLGFGATMTARQKIRDYFERTKHIIDPEPSVKVMRDGVEVEVPVSEYMKEDEAVAAPPREFQEPSRSGVRSSILLSQSGDVYLYLDDGTHRYGEMAENEFRKTVPPKELQEEIEGIARDYPGMVILPEDNSSVQPDPPTSHAPAPDTDIDPFATEGRRISVVRRAEKVADIIFDTHSIASTFGGCLTIAEAVRQIMSLEWAVPDGWQLVPKEPWQTMGSAPKDKPILARKDGDMWPIIVGWTSAYQTWTDARGYDVEVHLWHPIPAAPKITLGEEP